MTPANGNETNTPSYAPNLNIRVERPLDNRGGCGVTFYIPLYVGDGIPHQYFRRNYPGWRTLPLVGHTDLDLQVEADHFYQILNGYFSALDPKSNPLFDLDMNYKSDARRKASESESRVLFNKLAQSGYDVFHLLFESFYPPSPPDFEPEEFQQAKLLLLDLVRNYHLVLSFAEVRYTKLLFPWTLLFDRLPDPRATLEVCWSSCLAFRHQIEDTQDWASRRGALGALPRLQVAVCPRVDFHRLHSSASHPLQPAIHHGTYTVDWIPDMATVRARLRGLSDDGFYFFGHSDSTDDHPSKNWMELAGVKLTVADLAREGSPNYSKAVILLFINGCEAASISLNTITVRDLIGRLARLRHLDHRCEAVYRGPVHCLTTAHKLPTTFGALFAEEFWKSFFAGMTVGQAILTARLHMLHEYKNPLGFLYCFFGDCHLNCSPSPQLHGRSSSAGPPSSPVEFRDTSSVSAPTRSMSV